MCHFGLPEYFVLAPGRCHCGRWDWSKSWRRGLEKVSGKEALGLQWDQVSVLNSAGAAPGGSLVSMGTVGQSPSPRPPCFLHHLSQGSAERADFVPYTFPSERLRPSPAFPQALGMGYFSRLSTSSTLGMLKPMQKC